MPIILGSLKRYRKIWGPFLLWRGIYVYYILYIICIVSYFNKNELWLYDYVLRNIGSNYNEDKRRSRLCTFKMMFLLTASLFILYFYFPLPHCGYLSSTTTMTSATATEDDCLQKWMREKCQPKKDVPGPIIYVETGNTLQLCDSSWSYAQVYRRFRGRWQNFHMIREVFY